MNSIVADAVLSHSLKVHIPPPKSFKENAKSIFQKGIFYISNAASKITSISKISNIATKVFKFIFIVFGEDQFPVIQVIKVPVKAVKNITSMLKIADKTKGLLELNSKTPLLRIAHKIISFVTSILKIVKYLGALGFYNLGKAAEAIGKIPVFGIISKIPLGIVINIGQFVVSALGAVEDAIDFFSLGKKMEGQRVNLDKWSQRNEEIENILRYVKDKAKLSEYTQKAIQDHQAQIFNADWDLEPGRQNNNNPHQKKGEEQKKSPIVSPFGPAENPIPPSYEVRNDQVFLPPTAREIRTGSAPSYEELDNTDKSPGSTANALRREIDMSRNPLNQTVENQKLDLASDLSQIIQPPMRDKEKAEMLKLYKPDWKDTDSGDKEKEAFSEEKISFKSFDEDPIAKALDEFLKTKTPDLISTQEKNPHGIVEKDPVKEKLPEIAQVEGHPPQNVACQSSPKTPAETELQDERIHSPRMVDPSIKNPDQKPVNDYPEIIFQQTDEMKVIQQRIELQKEMIEYKRKVLSIHYEMKIEKAQKIIESLDEKKKEDKEQIEQLNVKLIRWKNLIEVVQSDHVRFMEEIRDHCEAKMIEKNKNIGLIKKARVHRVISFVYRIAKVVLAASSVFLFFTGIGAIPVLAGFIVLNILTYSFGIFKFFWQETHKISKHDQRQLEGFAKKKTSGKAKQFEQKDLADAVPVQKKKRHSKYRENRTDLKPRELIRV